MQLYLIKFISDLWQVGGLLLVLRVSSTNKTDRHDITEILLKVVLNTITSPIHISISIVYWYHIHWNISVCKLYVYFAYLNIYFKKQQGWSIVHKYGALIWKSIWCKLLIIYLKSGLKLTELDGSLPILQFCAFMKSNMAVAILLTWFTKRKLR
jgi:hypothetical protein